MTLTFNLSTLETSILPFVIQTEEQYHQALAIAVGEVIAKNVAQLVGEEDSEIKV